jgi:hypothetical protein
VQPNPTLPYPDADLREHPPRSPHEQLAGLYFLPRTIDKARAKIQGTLGLYKITPGISGYMFEALGITEDAFVEAVRAAASDNAVEDWLEHNADMSKVPELNEMLINRRLRDEEHRASFLAAYPILTERPELWNWFEIFELDDRWIFDPANRGKPGSALGAAT